MSTRPFARALAGSALAGGVLLVAGPAAPQLSLSAYQTVSATAMDVSNPTPVVAYGSQPKVTATVSSVGAPAGRIQFKIYTGSTYSTLYKTANINVAATSATTSAATYTFPADAPGGQSYLVTATFKSSSVDYSDSTANDTVVTILPPGAVALP